MHPAWVTDARVAVVAGKGGVGSSTVAAALALVAARAGADVLLLSIDGRPGVGPLLGGPLLTPVDTVMRRLPASHGGGTIRARTVPGEGAFADYLELKGVNALVRRAASRASLDVIAAATPGLEHLLVLGKIKELERERAADLVVVDAPPAGHAAPFLGSAAALLEVVAEGPVRTQALEVAEMLADPARCQAVLVTLPEETPVNEVVELAFDVEERLGLALAPLVVNGCWPERPGIALTPAAAAKAQGVTLDAATKRALDGSVRFGRARLVQQREQLARLTERLPLPRVELPRLTTPTLGPVELEVLADALSVAPRAGGAT
jgi:anion-transporting  ArsA/GET3 family ATPase